MISEEEKWQAVFVCDSAFDGQFFYGVKTTGIFCRPSCKSKTPKRANIVFFKNAQEARDYGLRIACAKQLLANTEDAILQIALSSGFESLSNFYAQFRRNVGVTPKQYREALSSMGE